MNESSNQGLVGVASARVYTASILKPATDFTRLENVLGQLHKKVTFSEPEKPPR